MRQVTYHCTACGAQLVRTEAPYSFLHPPVSPMLPCSERGLNGAYLGGTAAEYASDEVAHG